MHSQWVMRDLGNLEENEGTTDLPCSRSDNFMELWLALLAVVKFWAQRLICQAHAASVLPHMTIVALDKEISNVVRERI